MQRQLAITREGWFLHNQRPLPRGCKGLAQNANGTTRTTRLMLSSTPCNIGNREQDDGHSEHSESRGQGNCEGWTASVWRGDALHILIGRLLGGRNDPRMHRSHSNVHASNP